METYNSLLVDMFKHAAGRSGIEAACDLANLFQSLTTIVKSGSYKKLSCSKALKRNVHNTIDGTHKLGMELSSDTKRYCKHFLTSLPAIVYRAQTGTSAGVGFVRDGMVDANTYEWPHIELALAGTLIRPVTLDELNIFNENCERLVKEQMENGQISEATFNELSFDQDIKNAGNEEILNTKAESHQRAKCLTNESQKELKESVS